MYKFNEIKTPKELAEFLNIPFGKLTYILYSKHTENCYETFEIPKRDGSMRCIQAPKEDLKEVQRKLADALWEFQSDYIKENKVFANISHGFIKKKGIITNADVHKNKKFVLNLDLKNFFEQFHFGRVRGYFEKNRNFQLPIEVATVIAQLSCYQGKLPQGAPSSPIITNLICNILDIHLAKIAKKFRMNYTRYADDLSFSTNDKKFKEKQNAFLKEVQKEIEKFGFSINESKTRLALQNSRQEVTGLVVNSKVGVNKEYCKNTRAMADSLYRKNEFFINGEKGTIGQLEGRFSFINQPDSYNNRNDKLQKHSLHSLNTREKQYQKFLFYKYFFANQKLLVVTEGKTDIIYLRAALKKHYEEYPKLITKVGNTFEYRISFLRRTERLEYFLGIQQDGADTLKNIYNFYTGKNGIPNLYQYFERKSGVQSHKPVILLLDNEQKSDRPLKKFLKYSNMTALTECECKKISVGLNANLYLLTTPLIDGKEECEIEDMFEERELLHKIDGKTFSRAKDYNLKECYGKSAFAQYIASNYQKVNFTNFKPILDAIEKCI